jgi:DUF1365 family protein
MNNDISICIGTLWHKRYKTKEHEFYYKLNTWLIPINKDEYNYKNLFYKFRNMDYLRDSYKKEPNLFNRIKCKLQELNIVDTKSINQIYLLGQISNLGIYFSPLNLYFCYTDYDDKQCKYILCEVSNTPWNERHYYVLDYNAELHCQKAFHVSPFFNLNQTYKWRFDFKDNRNIGFIINSYENDSLVFSASYNCTAIPIHQKKTAIKHKFNVFKIYFGIYYEALRLFIKKVPFVSHPHKNSHNNYHK